MVSASVSDRYRFDEVVGRGGMGTVWRATDLLLGRTVAIKEIVLAPSTTPEERHDARFRVLREAHAAARVADPAVVTIHDVVEEGERLFLVMEYVAAPSLEEVVLRTGPLPPADVAALGARLAAALATAHRLGVIHRDVKPSNVLVPGDGGSARLVDFGIAALVDAPGVTSAGLVMGSPSYMAPEQVEGDPATPASDVFSLAATLYYAVEGIGPFPRDTTAATMAAVATQAPQPPVRAGAIGPVLLAMLAKDPAARPSITEAQTRLAALASGGVEPDWSHATPTATPVAAPTSGTRLVPSLQDRPEPAPPATPVGRVRRIVLAGLAVVVLAALMVAAVVLANQDDDPEVVDPTNTTAAPPTTEPTETTVDGGEVPAGFVEYADPQGGFTMLQPEGFDVAVDEENHVTELTAGATRIAVRWFAPPVDPIAFLEGERDRLAGFPEYREVSFEEQTFLDAPGGFWEFEFADPANPDVLMHSTGRAFVIGEDDEQVTYALFFRTPAGDFDQLAADTFSVVEQSFAPS